jgi:hypothetical protein
LFFQIILVSDSPKPDIWFGLVLSRRKMGVLQDTLVEKSVGVSVEFNRQYAASINVSGYYGKQPPPPPNKTRELQLQTKLTMT